MTLLHFVLGGDLHWKQPIKIRHLATRRFLKVFENNEVGLTADDTDPRIIFRLHPIGQVHSDPIGSHPDCILLDKDTVIPLAHYHIQTTPYWPGTL